MKLGQAAAQVVVPDGLGEAEALERTTHLGIGAHPDDLEIMTWQGIGSCRGRTDRWFTGVVVSDGAGSPRAGRFAGLSDADMRAARLEEQTRAATLGDYAALVWLGYASAAVKSAANPELHDDLVAVLRAARPEVLYTHNPFDGHDTHVAVCLRTIEAVRALAADEQPRALYGCEVWRGLDWVIGDDRAAFDVSEVAAGSVELLAVHQSQIAGGKRYDLGTLGRKQANATYADAHAVDRATAMEYAIDLTRLLREPELDIHTFAMELVGRFATDVSARLRRLMP